MLTKRCTVIFLCLLLVFSLAACHIQAPVTGLSNNAQKPSPAPASGLHMLSFDSAGLTDGLQEPGPDLTQPAAVLTDAELHSIEAYLNDMANNGFIAGSDYASPKNINLLWVFYNGAEINQEIDQWAAGEEAAVLEATGWPFTFNLPIKISREAANAFLLEKCGLSLADFHGTIPCFQYVEAYDAFYHMHAGNSYSRVTVLRGIIDQEGRYVIYYEDRYGWYTVTLLKTDSGYQFVSNVKNSDPTQVIINPYFSILTAGKTFYSASRKQTICLADYNRNIWKFAVTDLDADGEDELAVMWTDGSILILREENNSVTGFDFGLHSMYQLNEDGSYYWNATDGSTEGCSRLKFSGNQCTTTELWRVERNESGSVTYYVDNKSVSEQAYLAASQTSSRGVIWMHWSLKQPSQQSTTG